MQGRIAYAKKLCADRSVRAGIGDQNEATYYYAFG